MTLEIKSQLVMKRAKYHRLVNTNPATVKECVDAILDGTVTEFTIGGIIDMWLGADVLDESEQTHLYDSRSWNVTNINDGIIKYIHPITCNVLVIILVGD